MPKENNKMQVDIDTLKKQNVNDLLSIKELYKRIEELGEKTSQIKYIDNTLVKKLKKEYDNLKKIILDENIQVKLTYDIETINSQMDTKVNKSDIETINSQMDNNTRNIDFLNGNILFKYNAVGDGNSHKANTIFTSLEKAREYYPTIQSLDDELDLLAIEKALTETKNIKIPKGIFLLNRTLSLETKVTLQGDSRLTTVLKATHNNSPILQLNGDSYRISKLRLQFSRQQKINETNGCGIKKNIMIMGHSIFEDLQIEFTCYGIFSDNGGFYSNVVRDIWIGSYTNSAIYIDGVGSTGNVFSNIYTTNWSNYSVKSKNRCNTVFHFQGISESNFDQLNVEHTICKRAITVNSCDNAIFNSIHFEGIENITNYSGLWDLLSSNVIINGLTYSFSAPLLDDGITDNNIFKLTGNVNLIVNGVKCHNLGIVEAWSDEQGNYNKEVDFSSINNKICYKTDNIQKNVKIVNFVDDKNIFRNYMHNMNVNKKPVDLIQFNNEIYYSQSGSIPVYHFNKRVDSGVWDIGERNEFSKIITDFNYIGEICIEKGDFSQPTTDLTCTVAAWKSSITIDNNGTYKLKKGDRIQIEGVTDSDENNYFVINSDLYSGNKYNVTKVTGNFNLSNCKIKIAPPTFKGYGMLAE